MTAETMSSVAFFHMNRTYRQEDYDKAWWEVCLNQHHDALPGSALNTTVPAQRDRYGLAGILADETAVTLTQAMSRRVDMSRVKEGSVFCFNPLPWAREATLELQLIGDISAASGGSPFLPPVG